MFNFIISWAVARLGMKNAEGLSVESLLLQDEHQLLAMGEV